MAYHFALTISLLLTVAGVIGVYFEITKRRKSPTPSSQLNYLDEMPEDELSGKESPKTEDLHETRKQAALSPPVLFEIAECERKCKESQSFIAIATRGYENKKSQEEVQLELIEHGLLDSGIKPLVVAMAGMRQGYEKW
jgi:hypothetical protein